MAGRTSTAVITQREKIIISVAIVIPIALLIVDLGEIAFPGIWDSVGAWVYNFQSLLTGIPILIAAIIAYRGIQKQIKETNDRFEKANEQKRLQTAALYAAVLKSVAIVFNWNARTLENSPGLPMNTISLVPYERLMNNLLFLPGNLSTILIGLFEHARQENKTITEIITVINSHVDSFIKIHKKPSLPEIHEHVRKKSPKELNYGLIQWDLAQIFYSLSAWLEHVAEGGEELSEKEAQKRFGKFGLNGVFSITSEEEYNEIFTRANGLKNAKETTAEFCAYKVLSILIAQYKDTKK